MASLILRDQLLRKTRIKCFHPKGDPVDETNQRKRQPLEVRDVTLGMRVEIT